MKVLMLFWNLNIFHRYFPQINSIAKKCDEFTIVYKDGFISDKWCNNISFVEIDLPNYPYHLKYILGLRTVWNQIKDIKVDVYYTLSGLWLQYFTTYFAKKSNKTFIIRLRGDDRLSRINMNQNKYFIKIFGWFNSKSFQKADAVIPICEKLIETAKRYGVKDNRITEVVLNGIDVNLFKYSNIHHDKFTVGYAGRISLEKGSAFLNFLIRSMNKVDPDIVFNVVGAIQSKLEHSDNLNYIGILNYEDMPEFYEDCDIVILPSLNEGFPNAILEAYLSGKVIIASENAFPVGVPLFGFVLDFCCLKWIRAILRMKELKEGLQLEQIGIIASEYIVNNFSWDIYSDKIITIFEENKKGDIVSIT